MTIDDWVDTDLTPQRVFLKFNSKPTIIRLAYLFDFYIKSQ